ncbi:MAG: hypothetical protein OSB19_10630 [Opitutaceae bacterium]|nr:hypothetical protein [Opitutaceae bacterium]
MNRILVTEAVKGKAMDQLRNEPDLGGVFEPDLWNDPDAPVQAIAAFTNEAQERVVASVCRDSAAAARGQTAEGFFNFPQPKKQFP